MRQLLPCCFQRQVLQRLSWLSAVLLTGSAFGQPTIAPRFPDWTNSNLVTIQELHHVVPGKARKEMEKALKSYARHRTDEAIGHLKQAILIDPEFVAARNNLAAFLMPTNLELAVAQLEEAVKVDPRNPTLYANLAVAYGSAKQFDAAERAARAALSLDGTMANARLFLGLALVVQQKFTDEALECFQRTQDEYPIAHLFASSVFQVRGNPQRARSEIQTYLSSGDQKLRGLANRWVDLIDQNERKNPAQAQ